MLRLESFEGRFDLVQELGIERVQRLRPVEQHPRHRAAPLDPDERERPGALAASGTFAKLLRDGKVARPSGSVLLDQAEPFGDPDRRKLGERAEPTSQSHGRAPVGRLGARDPLLDQSGGDPEGQAEESLAHGGLLRGFDFRRLPCPRQVRAELGLEERGRCVRRSERTIQTRLGVEGDGDTGDVHEFERAESGAEEFPANLLDRREARDVLLGEAGRLVEVGNEVPVHAEAGSVGGRDRDLPDQVREPLEFRDDGGLGRGPGDDLDELVHRRGVEEVETREPAGVREPVGQLGDRERGGVRGDHRIPAHEGSYLREQHPLHVPVLEDRLDHERRLPNRFGEVGRERDASEHLVPLRARDLLSGDRPREHLLDQTPAPGDRGVVHVTNPYAEAGWAQA